MYSLVFLKGVHNLSYDFTLSGHDLTFNISTLVFQGQGSLPGDTVIYLLPLTTISLNNVAQINLFNIYVEGHVAERSGNSSVVFLHIYLIDLNQFKTSNVTITSDASTHQISIRECNFSNSTLDIKANNIILAATSALAAQQNTSGLDLEVHSSLEIRSCSLPAVMVFCLSTNCSVMVDSSNITTVKQPSHFRSNGNVVIQNSQIFGGIQVSDSPTLLIQSCMFFNDIEMDAIFLGGSNHSQLTIQDSAFVGGKNGIYTAVTLWDLSISGCRFQSIEEDNIYIENVENSVFIRDTIFSGGEKGVDVQNVHGLFNILKCKFQNIKNENILLSRFKWADIRDSEVVGGSYGVRIAYWNCFYFERSLQIHNASISNTDYGLSVNGETNNTKQRVVVSDSVVKNNAVGIVDFNSPLIIQRTIISGNGFGMVHITAWYTTQVNNCSFFSNERAAIAAMIGIVEISDCHFYENLDAPIRILLGHLIFRGENIIRDNTAVRGGGLALSSGYVTFSSGSKTKFINNTAIEYGGAIYKGSYPVIFWNDLMPMLHESRLSDVIRQYSIVVICFLFYEDCNNCITFSDNKATLGGLDVYGVTAETCSIASTTDTLNLFKFDNGTLSTSFRISSDPTRVCFCVDNVPQCENKTFLMLNETRYPGETFSTSVALAGYNFSRVAGSVHTSVLGQDYSEVINHTQHVQTVGLMECGALTYTVSSNKTDKSVILVLTVQEYITHKQIIEKEIEKTIRNVYLEECSVQTKLTPCLTLVSSYQCEAILNCTNHFTTPVFINVTLEVCPLGFETRKVCVCDEFIRSINLTCHTVNHTGYITREGTVWVGMDKSENNTDVYYWHRYCHRDYCDSSLIPIELRSPDEQCSSNRSGVLCGRCRTGYSLQLGGNKCIKCDDYFLSLLIVFTVLGILLVVVIKLLDLTVASGTVNGLIFYANVVWRNNAILFSLQDKRNIGYYIVTLPIAWINLDFGIETCFSENFDQLTKTGLQFVFPVYIWCIAGLIIIISHFSTRATKLFGNNSVAVLATLFLLSYGKLLKSITDVLTFADVSDSNGTSRKVWSLDGNVRYGMTPGHIVLIVVALLFLILFLLPFTLTLLLVPFLRAKSHLRPLHWINTLKPFFDTFYGPFKDKKQHQVWTGILLISRVLILIVFASTSTYSPKANILLMAVIATLLLMYSAMVGLLYKKWSLSLLENTYIINLAILGGAVLSHDIPNDTLSPFATTSVVIAQFTFLCTVVIYTAKRIIPVEKFLTPQNEAVKPKPVYQPVPQARNEAQAPTVQVIELNKYDSSVFRETLLEDS